MESRIVAILLVVLCNPLSAIGEDIMSMAIGYHGMKEVVDSPDWQSELDVSPEQLDKLRKFIGNEQLAPLRRLNYFTFTRNEELNSDAIRAANRFFNEGVSKILTREQLAARRKLYLRNRFAFPLDAFNTNVPKQIGLSDEDILKVKMELNKQGAELAELIGEMRDEAILDVLELSPQFSDKFVECFGTSLLPRPLKTKARFRSESFGLFKEDQGEYLVTSCIALQLPRGVAPISDVQRTQILDIDRQVRVKRAKDANFNSDRALIDGVTGVLDRSQLDGLKEVIHVALLRASLIVLTYPNVLKYFDADEEQGKQIKAICNNKQDEISALRRKKELNRLTLILSKLPSDKMKELTELFADVWTEK